MQRVHARDPQREARGEQSANLDGPSKPPHDVEDGHHWATFGIITSSPAPIPRGAIIIRGRITANARIKRLTRSPGNYC
jgi:hypothetical protein